VRPTTSAAGEQLGVLPAQVQVLRLALGHALHEGAWEVKLGDLLVEGPGLGLSYVHDVLLPPLLLTPP
jgi:hypothetical protein